VEPVTGAGRRRASLSRGSLASRATGPVGARHVDRVRQRPAADGQPCARALRGLRGGCVLPALLLLGVRGAYRESAT
jgi:hypothetical protein